jgi:mRNA interferase MazF
MVKQGNILMINFNRKSGADSAIGHEQSGYRPAMVVSNDFFNARVNLTIVCPITNTDNGFPLHVALDNRTKTTGFVMCEYVKSLDLKSRGYSYVEKAPIEIVKKVVNILYGEIEV